MNEPNASLMLENNEDVALELYSSPIAAEAEREDCNIRLESFTAKLGLSQQMIDSHEIDESEQLILKCEFCLKVFSDKSGLNKHLRIHTGEKPYQCEKCHFKFTQTAHLQQHMASVHVGLKPFQCEVCLKCFTQKASLTTHYRIHTGERPFGCTYDECDKRFYKRSDLSRHIKTHSGVKPYKCEFCEKYFTCKYNLKEHHKIHLGVKNFKCDVCEMLFVRKADMILHVRMHTGEKPFQCNYCSKRFNQKSNMNKHIRRDHVGCPVPKRSKKFLSPNESVLNGADSSGSSDTVKKQSNKVERESNNSQNIVMKIQENSDVHEIGQRLFPNHDMILKNLRDAASDEELVQDIDDMESPSLHIFQGKGVSESTKQAENSDANSNFNINDKTNPVNKSQIVFPGMDLSEDEVKPKASDTILYLEDDKEKDLSLERAADKKNFNICSQSFTTKSDLNQQINNAQISNEQSNPKCKYCSKVFPDRGRLRKHLQAHKGEKPFECIQCHFKFSKAVHLQQHMASVHVGLKPFQCELCLKGFTQKASLLTHYRIHTGDRPFGCTYDECDKRFYKRSDLSRHLKTHSGEKPYKCEFCDKYFACKYNLKGHRKIHLGVKNFKCHVCDTVFVRKADLILHARMHIGELPFQCDYCSKRFSQKTRMSKHIRTDHVGCPVPKRGENGTIVSNFLLANASVLCGEESSSYNMDSEQNIRSHPESSQKIESIIQGEDDVQEIVQRLFPNHDKTLKNLRTSLSDEEVNKDVGDDKSEKSFTVKLETVVAI